MLSRLCLVASNDGPSSGGSLSTLEKRGWWCFSLSLSLVLERKSNNTLERRRPEEDPKENDNNSKKKQSAFLLCRDDLRRRLQKKKRVCFVAPFNKCREYRRGTQSERERERRRSHTKKGIKLSQKKRFLTYDLGFRVLLKPAKIAPFCMSFSFALT